MQAILDWFASVSDTISSVIDYFVGVIEDLVEMAIMLGYAAADIPSILSFLPSPIVTILVSFLTAAILYKVLGREG